MSWAARKYGTDDDGLADAQWEAEQDRQAALEDAWRGDVDDEGDE